MPERFATKVSECMAERGMTPNQLSRRSGIRPDGLERIFDGTSNPTFSQIVRLKRVLKPSDDEEFDYLAIGLIPAERDQAMAVRQNAIAIHSDGRVFARFPKPQGANDIAA